MKKFIIISIALIAVAAISYFLISQTSKIDYNTQVKPIINKNCIACHGGVRRKADFSLLFPQDAVAKNESGKPAIIPGDASHSELIRRITSDDPEVRMPYKKSPLTKDEIEILRKWIDQGMEWGNHWAYVPVKEQAQPKQNDWSKTNVDGYILDKLEENDLNPSPSAPKEKLLRRVALDLIGLPADESLSNKYLNNELSYEDLVDSLLQSKHFGERWTAVWMDLARYADTKGYERDDTRNIWRYRDWLINAFNRDMPYDSFLIEQLAGDLLPHPTDEQLIATAFHRNTMTNDEGGTDNEEFRTAAVIDRVNTTWEVLMGTTFSCVQCHSHPYDPFRHEEYYKFMAFFNNARDEDTYDEYPVLRHYEKEDLNKLSHVVQWAEKNISADKAKEINLFLKTWQPAINSIRADKFINSELTDTKWLIFRNNAVCRLANVELSDVTSMIYRYSSFTSDGIWEIHLDKPDGPILKTINLPNIKRKWEIKEINFRKQFGRHDLYFTYTNKSLTKPEMSGVIFDWFYFSDYSMNQSADKKMATDYWTLLNKNPKNTPIMLDNPLSMKRATRVFERGNWLVKGDTVDADVPNSIIPMPEGAPKNRLGLAQWMISLKHPLTSRTIVNRIWEQLFGNGLVETLEDMGTQGATPTHPELLDHLSYQLMHEYKWSIKRLLKEIVLSSTYQQDSKVTKEHLAKDAHNEFYARAPRVRLSAEQLRDQALAVSGLLSKKMYGPSVMPYQPDGIWRSPYAGDDWVRSRGEDQYRRGLYTFWKRTSPYPSMMTFDGTAREVCSTRRIRTNTPLQALVTLNDSVFVEASTRLAMQMRKEKTNLDEQISWAYSKAIGHTPTKETIGILKNLYTKSVSTVTMKSVSSQKQNPVNQEEKAFMLVANAILNLDEFITKN